MCVWGGGESAGKIFDTILLYFVIPFNFISHVSYRILGRGYFPANLFAENNQTEIEGMGWQLKH